MKFKIVLMIISFFQSSIQSSFFNNNDDSDAITNSSVRDVFHNEHYQQELRAFLESIGIRPFENPFHEGLQDGQVLDFFANQNQHQREQNNHFNSLLNINNNENEEVSCCLLDCQLI